MDDQTDALETYSSYVAEIMTSMITFIDPTIRVDLYDKDILKTAKVVTNFSKTIFKMSADAENSTKPDKSNILTDLIDISIDDLQNLTDDYVAPKRSIINWTKYVSVLFKDLTKSRFNKSSDFVLTSTSDLKYLRMLSEFLINSTTDEIELYIWWSVVEELIVHTTKSMRDLQVQYSQSLTSLESTVSRSLYCTGGVNQLMGMAVAYFVVDDRFLNETKPRVERMLKNIQESFDNFLSQIDWMDAKTKKMTLQKSNAMKSLIGFPEWLLNKTALEQEFHDVSIQAGISILSFLSV